MPREEIEQLFRAFGCTLLDPFTKLPPRNEPELAAAFVVAQSRQNIQWHSIEFHAWRGDLAVALLADRLEQSGLVLAEYPLCSAPGACTDRWGDMRADAIFKPNGADHVIMFEAKVDSHFTYADEPPDGQISRQFEYLQHLPAIEKTLVVICPRCNLDWYKKRLIMAWEHLADRSGLSACLILWEQLFVLQT